MTSPKYLSLDFETALTDNTPSIEYWRDDFRILSAAAAWEVDGGIKTKFLLGEGNIREFLTHCQDIHLLLYNLTFELGCLMYRFPDI